MSENNKILVIDDDEGIRETYSGIFTPEEESDVLAKGKSLFDGEDAPQKPAKSIAYEVSLAENGTKGIEKVSAAKEAKAPFAVAFVDMKMPGLNGAQTSQKIWEIDPDIKIVIVTAYSEYAPEDIIAVTGRDDLFYLRKPFNHEEILQFARALTNEWNLERKRDALEAELKQANETLADMNENLKEKVQKQAAMIVQAEKMASVGLLAAGVAHEINNPIAFVNSNLSAVKTYFKKITGLYEKFKNIESFLDSLNTPQAEQVLKELADFKTENKIEMIFEDLEDLADESIDGIDRVKTIVRDLKTFSRIDEAELKAVDINAAIDTTLNMVKNEFKYKAEVEKRYADLPPVVCFPQKISQVFMNLLINAGQSIEEKGKIIIETKRTALGRREGDQYIGISIIDSGCGIPEEHLNKLFDPFFTTKPVGTGTGLGLNIVYEIIKAHGGKIDVDSKPGEGTRFTILLPVNREIP